MERVLTYTISRPDAGKSVLTFLKEKKYSRNLIVYLKKMRPGIVVNNEWVYISHELKEHDILTIRLTEQQEQKILPLELPFGVVYEDEDLLVADKPACMPVHPSIEHYTHTLANAVAFHAAQRQEQYPFRCINRLDRDTSGLTLIAKNPYSSCMLYEQMRNRKIQRTYYAIAEGYTQPEGCINAPIARRPGSVIERTVDFESGEYAVTHYKTLASHGDLSFLKLRLDTGRTHQIRVHMSYLGHPLAGDFLYNNQKNSRIQRQALHAGNLEFVHPVNGQVLRFSTPLPEDMLNLLHMIIS